MVGDHHCNNDCYDLYGNYMVDVQGRGRIRVCDQMAELKDMREHLESAHGLKFDKIFADASKKVAETCKEMLDEKIKDGSVDGEKPGGKPGEDMLVDKDSADVCLDKEMNRESFLQPSCGKMPGRRESSLQLNCGETPEKSGCQDEVLFGEEAKTSKCTEPLTRTKARRLKKAWKKKVKK